MTRVPCLGLFIAILVVPLLQGCLGAMAAVQAFPAIIGGVSVAGSGDRSPFIKHAPSGSADAEDDVAALGNKIRRAECGDPQSQYWLAARLDNGFNADPNYVEVYKWYRLAELGGFNAASERVAALDATLPETQVLEARALAGRWQPATENCPELS
jgi:TPR repeat protein